MEPDPVVVMKIEAMMLPKSEHRASPPLLATLAVSGYVATAGWISFIVMSQRGMACDARSVAIGTLAVAAALVPPLWFDVLANLKVASPLATTMWRLGVLLPAIAYTTQQTEPVRNCMQGTLLACYLMTLPLESWLLIRQSSLPRQPEDTKHQ